MKSQAEQKLIFNGSEVAKVKTQAGGTVCDSWSGFIEANNSASMINLLMGAIHQKGSLYL
ncbi:MAG: hypothetical protein AB8W37_08020 [Arsenophonus endosymbiont of Dermacentor nuttalli]